MVCICVVVVDDVLCVGGTIDEVVDDDVVVDVVVDVVMGVMLSKYR